MANAHTSAQKEFIVRRLGAFYTPKDIATAFRTQWPDTKCDENDVNATDPRLVVVSPDLHAAFYSERERVLEDPNAAPFVQQQARLIALSRQAERYENNNQPAEARAVFRQIAEELGVVSGKGGGKAPAPSTPGTDGHVVAITRTIIDPANDAVPE